MTKRLDAPTQYPVRLATRVSGAVTSDGKVIRFGKLATKIKPRRGKK